MQLVFATHNNNKVREIKPLFPPSVSISTLTEIGINEEIPETAETIEGNAILKARFVYNTLKLNCFADDTGLEVSALNGAPGVYSARYAGEGKTASDNIAKLLYELKGKSNRSAKFKTVIAAIINGKEYLFEGLVNGNITLTAAGANGFGYDPVFMPEGLTTTFAEIPLEQKNRLSHRALAVNKFIEFLKAKI
ncbi:MAG TPA: non-canonical purine NTP diphosphatase [Bacteroidia bacterium]|nr:non-canonical purine NTP diphosphatase [Bacteroidia bacterium]